MHIPDGYLSPSTCAVAFAAALPFWGVAFRRMGRLLHTRMVPLLALFSAFSFVIMMFNLPLPGGTTGHAVGVAVAAIVLGPWGSMVAISVALLIQALFFGDGGLTTFGANSFNMAVVGSLVAWVAYTVIAGRSEVTSSRRVVGAAVAGYLAINAAALLTAFEFGIQPGLFHDAAGAPLYAPYPLSIALPAMMIGHLTVAGLAELLLSAGVVAWLQRAHPELLSFAEGGAATSTRTLWYGLAGLMIMTPLGLLAVGSAWGEWGAADFTTAEARQEIAGASLGVAPPVAAPEGLERLAALWTAPIPDYAPAFMQSAGYGYILSALLGAGVILLLFLVISGLAARRPPAA
jgi:cobalt/nickel transport system permease protein